MRLFKPKAKITVTYHKRSGKANVKSITATPTAKRNIYKIMLNPAEYIEVSVEL